MIQKGISYYAIEAIAEASKRQLGDDYALIKNIMIWHVRGERHTLNLDTKKLTIE